MKEEKIYLYTFVDSDFADIDNMYQIATNRDCGNLIESIEEFYYDFENYENIDELVRYLTENNADKELIDYIVGDKEKDVEDLTISGIYGLTLSILFDLNVLLSFEEKRFTY